MLIPFWGMNARKLPTDSFTGVFAVTSEIVGYLQAGQLYIHIHTPTYPDGEIRGQISAVPEPATMLLLGTGLAGVGVRIRKRRQSNI